MSVVVTKPNISNCMSATNMSTSIQPIKEAQFRHVIALVANKPCVVIHYDRAAGLAIMTLQFL
jgi:hypothetical protein